jgi:hypothetical protein
MKRFEFARRVWPTSLCAVVALCTGCGSGEYSPTRGNVRVGGAAPKGAVVALVRQSDSKDDGIRVSGKVAEDGSFILHTTETKSRAIHKGVRPGKYIVLITWSPELTWARLNDAESLPDLFGGRYSDPKTSPLRAVVNRGGTELPPIELPASDRIGN